MPSLPVRSLLFASSYAPLAGLYALLLYSQNRPVAIGLVAISVVTVLALIWFLRVHATQGNVYHLRIGTVQRQSGETMSYLATYLLPFLTFTFTVWQQVVAVIIFVALVGVIYVRGNMIHVNPMLACMGYHVYSISTKPPEASSDLVDIGNGPYLLIAKEVFSNHEISAAKSGDGLFIRVKDESNVLHYRQR